jgi:hypothetical protein
MGPRTLGALAWYSGENDIDDGGPRHGRSSGIRFMGALPRRGDGEDPPLAVTHTFP